MVKIFRKSLENHQKLVFLLTNNRHFVVIALKMFKMEFKFKYTILMMKV